MPNRDECPQAETVARLIEGELSASERAELEKHIAQCADCYRELTESTEVWWRIRRPPPPETE